MTVNPTVIKKAKDFLELLYEDLLKDPLYKKSGEDFLSRMEWEIRRYDEELFEAVKVALGDWLDSHNGGKFDCALDLIERFKAIEYLPKIEKLHDDIKTRKSVWSPLYLEFVQTVLETLRHASKKTPG